jgi:hypothetical protein
MKIVNTHGLIYPGTPLQAFARLRHYADGRTELQFYGGGWVAMCPGNEDRFKPMRIIPNEHTQRQTPQHPNTTDAPPMAQGAQAA